MDVNHETYNNDLRKIAFVLSFMTTGSAATWKAQFIEEAYAKPVPANPNNRLGTYTQFRKDLIKAFSMFDSIWNALDELQSQRRWNRLMNTLPNLKCWQLNQKLTPRTSYPSNCLRKHYPGL
jgi:hypothetical protein